MSVLRENFKDRKSMTIKITRNADVKYNKLIKQFKAAGYNRQDIISTAIIWLERTVRERRVHGLEELLCE